jgi:hypothetical protein
MEPMHRRDIMRGRRKSESEPLAGLFTLTRKMEEDEVDQFDVDITIMDFLAYKAIAIIFEWRSTPNPYSSDLPSALATMTAGTPYPNTKHGLLHIVLT